MLKKFLILFCVAFSGACSSFDGDGLTNGSYSQGKRLDPNCDHFYGKKTRRYITLCPIGYYEDRFNDDHFRVNTGIDNSWSEVSGNKADELYFLGLGVDLRHPHALEAARDFFYAFFIDKLSLVEMEQKIIRFDIEEGWKFK